MTAGFAGLVDSGHWLRAGNPRGRVGREEGHPPPTQRVWGAGVPRVEIHRDPWVRLGWSGSGNRVAVRWASGTAGPSEPRAPGGQRASTLAGTCDLAPRRTRARPGLHSRVIHLGGEAAACSVPGSVRAQGCHGTQPGPPCPLGTPHSHGSRTTAPSRGAGGTAMRDGAGGPRARQGEGTCGRWRVGALYADPEASRGDRGQVRPVRPGGGR